MMPRRRIYENATLAPRSCELKNSHSFLNLLWTQPLPHQGALQEDAWQSTIPPNQPFSRGTEAPEGHGVPSVRSPGRPRPVKTPTPLPRRTADGNELQAASSSFLHSVSRAKQRQPGGGVIQSPSRAHDQQGSDTRTAVDSVRAMAAGASNQQASASLSASLKCASPALHGMCECWYRAVRGGRRRCVHANPRSWGMGISASLQVM
jgi:hypothetical protein